MEPVTHKTTPQHGNAGEVGIRIVIETGRVQSPRWLIETCEAPRVGDRILWDDPTDRDRDGGTPYEGKIEAVSSDIRRNSTRVTVLFNESHCDFGRRKRFSPDEFVNLAADDRRAVVCGWAPIHGTFGAAL